MSSPIPGAHRPARRSRPCRAGSPSCLLPLAFSADGVSAVEVTLADSPALDEPLDVADGPVSCNESRRGAVGAASARYASSEPIIFSRVNRLFSNPPERWSPSGWECEWYSSIAWWRRGISRLIMRQFFLGHSQFARGFPQRLFLLGIGDGVAPLLRDLALVQVGSRLHQVFLTLLDLRLPVAELVALEPVAHAAQLHVNAAERVARVLRESAHRQLEVLERLDGQDVG